MKAIVVLLAGVVVDLAIPTSSVVVAGSPDDADTWSQTTRQLQARVKLVERPAINGTRSLVPYLSQ